MIPTSDNLLRSPTLECYYTVLVPTNHIVSIDWLKENLSNQHDCSITQNVV
nr:MAG TPA: hypothetical protein [Caudoviricetes sp.]